MADQAKADVVHPRTAVLGRHRAAEQAQLRHLRQDCRIEAMLPIELANVRSHFTRRPLPDGLFEELLFVVEIKIDHERVLHAENKGLL
jgi:hypothetical protein